jgi:hypothetical protein
MLIYMVKVVQVIHNNHQLIVVLNPNMAVISHDEIHDK